MNLLEKYGIVPNNSKLYEMAFTHKSYGVNNDLNYDYERLEFLGDSILSMLVSEYLYKKYAKKGEGKLTKLRSNYVCEAALIYYSKILNLDKDIQVYSDEEMKITKNEVLSINADVFESILGAIYLDQGIEKTREFLKKTVFNYIDKETIFFNDYKSKIKEYGDAKEVSIEYKLIEEFGYPHDKTFIMEIYVDGKKIGKGIGKSKKEAEQLAAQKAINKLNIE
ncbi:MAG: ribonuclease III [Methanobacteriaceae archaeon]|jgi:ribonuclease-3|nr:ribonuclease III [Candidatus Methanorudis spinitermitis]